MLVAPHASAGVAIGVLVANPLVAIPAAIASHFVLDTVPHWQETLAPYQPTRKTYIRIPIDIGLAIAITAIGATIQPTHTTSIVLGALFATMPDLDVILITFPELKRGLLKLYWNWHCAIQKETSSLWGIAPQIGVILISLTTIFNV